MSRPKLLQPRGVAYRFIALTKGYIVAVDEEDFEWLSRFNWYAKEARGTYYAERTNGINHIAMHRLILGVDNELEVDHADHDGLNNRKYNLRVVDNYQNAWNSKISKRNTSGYKGVSFDKEKRKWNARIYYKGQLIRLGMYLSKEEASEVYRNKSIELRGEFAYERNQG